MIGERMMEQGYMNGVSSISFFVFSFFGALGYGVVILMRVADTEESRNYFVDAKDVFSFSHEFLHLLDVKPVLSEPAKV